MSSRSPVATGGVDPSLITTSSELPNSDASTSLGTGATGSGGDGWRNWWRRDETATAGGYPWQGRNDYTSDKKEPTNMADIPVEYRPAHFCMSRSPPMLLCRRFGDWVSAHTPAWVASILATGGDGLRHVCGGGGNCSSGTGASNVTPEERARAARDALIVLHLAGLLIVLEVAHGVRLSRRARQCARARRLRRQQQQQREGAAAAAALSNSTLSTTGMDVHTDEGVTAALSSSDPNKQNLRSEVGIRRASGTGAPAVARRVLRRGQRLVTYWQLVATAVQDGVLKEPSTPIAPDRILAFAADLSRMNSGPARGNGGGGSDSHVAAHAADALLVLPAAMCFAIPVSDENRHRPHSTTAVSANSASNDSDICNECGERTRSATGTGDTRAEGEWVALYLLWTDTVRYTVNADEIRKLLLSYPDSFYKALFATDSGENGGEEPCAVEPRVRAARIEESRAKGARERGSPTSSAQSTTRIHTHTTPATATCRALRVAVVSLALVWRLSLLRRVYDALVLHEDTERCADDEAELAEYSDAIYRHCIAPWRERESHLCEQTDQVLCDPARAWLQLTFAHDKLRRLFCRLTVLSVGSLFRHLYASSKSKCVSAGLLAVLTALSARVTAAGMRARQSLAQVLASHFHRTAEGDDGCGDGWRPAGRCRDANGPRFHDYRNEHRCDWQENGNDSSRSNSEHNGNRGDGQHRAHSSSHTSDDPFVLQVVSLCAFELIQLTVNTILTASSKQFITVAAAQRRDAVKAQLYAALTHMPLSFYDIHTYDDIEVMVYYVNDLEGVDVHVHQYLFTAATALMAVRDALQPLPRGARALILSSVAMGYGIRGMGRVVTRWWAQRRALRATPPYHHHRHRRYASGNSSSANSEEGDDNTNNYDGDGGSDSSSVTRLDAYGGDARGDAQEEENTGSGHARDGIMLRGLEIIAALPLLRPYGADVSLMAWWNQRVARNNGGKTVGGDGDEASGPVGVMRSILGSEPGSRLIPAFGNAMLSFADWLLPVFTSTYGAHTALCRREAGSATATTAIAARLMDATKAVQAAVEAALDLRRVVEVVLHNAYKACVLERILSPRSWESTSAENIARVESVAAPHSWDDALVKPPPIALYRMFAQHQRADTYREAEAAAHSRRSYRNLVVTSVIVRDLQFAYPSNPTVSVFAKPVTAQLQLWDPATGRGRFVCLTGPSGQGKSTLLSLLLGLYTDYRGVSMSANNGESAATAASFESSTNSLATVAGTEGRPAIELKLTHRTRRLAGHCRQRRGYDAAASAIGEDGGVPDSPDVTSRERALSSPVTTECPLVSPVAESDETAANRKGSAHDDDNDDKDGVYMVDLRQVPCDVLRGQLFSYMPQYPTIFAGATIAHNITLRPFVSLEETALLAKAQACADAARCDYIRRFPQGLLTPVGDNASLRGGGVGGGGGGGGGLTDGGGLVRLSGGQAQRMMVARALFHGGDILLMDEPSASLDSATKTELLREWRQLLDEGRIKGIICATHDEAVMAAADEVVSLPTS